MKSRQIINEILDAQNKLRTDPTYYIPILEDMLQYFDSKYYKRPGYTTIITKEGKTAVKNAIKFLSVQEPIHALINHTSLNKAAQDHADDSGTHGSVGIVDSNGSTMSDRIERYSQWEGQIGECCSYREIYDGGHEIVLGLLIDDGVKNRGDRKNIFNPSFNYVGVGLAKHPKYGHICVMDYAHSVAKRPNKIKSTPKFSDGLLASVRRTRANRFGKSKPSYEFHKQPKEGEILDISEVPKSIKDSIRKMDLGSDPKIKYEKGVYKISSSPPSYQIVKKSQKTETVRQNDFDHLFEKAFGKDFNKSFDHTFDNSFDQDLEKLSEFERFGELGDLEKFHEIEDFKDDNEPEGYIEKNTKTNITTFNGKTTKKTETTYKFADGSSKILTSTKIY